MASIEVLKFLNKGNLPSKGNSDSGSVSHLVGQVFLRLS